VTAPHHASGTVRRRVVVRGRVHGVGFRASCARRAVGAGVTGWVRNTPDGDVEAVFEGPVAAVDALVAWCRQGPPMAHVVGIEVAEELPAPETTFAIR
jgi:acylphosphatase